MKNFREQETEQESSQILRLFIICTKKENSVSSEGERESERERERANGKGKGCEAIKEFKRRGGRDVEPYLDVDHNERRWDQ